MRNRFFSVVAILALSGALCISCNKEKIPPPSNAKQATTTPSSSGDARYGDSSSSDEGSSSEGSEHSGGCSNGG